MFYNGFQMTNNCIFITVNGVTEDMSQICKGDYNGGTSITCQYSSLAFQPFQLTPHAR